MGLFSLDIKDTESFAVNTFVAQILSVIILNDSYPLCHTI